MKHLLEFLLIHLVEHPDEIEISEEKNDLGEDVYKVTVHPEDIGQVIGKKGHRIKAIRKIIQIKAAQISARFKIVLNNND